MTDPLWEALRRQHLEETHRASGSCPGWTCPTAQVLAALTQPAAPAEGLDARGECPACTEQPHIGCEYAKEPTDD